MALSRLLGTLAVAMLALMLLEVCAMKDLGWEVGERAYKRCRLKGSVVPKGSCSRIQDVVERSFDTMAVNLADAWNMSTRDADTNARSPAFQRSMDALIDTLIGETIEKQLTTENDIAREFQMKFFKWYTNVMNNKPEPDLSGLNLGAMKGTGGMPTFTGPNGQQDMPPNFDPKNAPWLKHAQPPQQPEPSDGHEQGASEEL